MRNVKTVAGAAAIALSLAACGSGGSTGSASAEDYPDGDINMVVTYAAGGPTDLAGRGVAKSLEEQFGVTVVVENVEGASGAIGSQRVADARPDGMTIGMTTASAVSRVPIIEDLPLSPDDVAPIGIVTEYPGVFFVRDDSEYQSIEDLIEAAEASPNSITIGQAGATTPQSVEIARMGEEYDVEFKSVPFEGDAPALTGLLGGNVDVIVPAYSETVRAQAEAGEIRPLAVMGAERLEYLPDVPTLAEIGYDDLTYGVSSFILIAPAETPEDIVAKLEDALESALGEEATRKAVGELGVKPEFVGAEALRQQMDDEVETLRPILEQLFQ